MLIGKDVDPHVCIDGFIRLYILARFRGLADPYGFKPC